MSKEKNKFKLNLTTILLSLILFLSLTNGCNSCTNKKMLTNSTNEILKKQEIQQKTVDSLSKELSTIKPDLKKSIETNAEASVIIEKEIDNERNLKPTQVKKYFKQYRDE